MRVDPRAASGFASAADAYERGRPGYPAEAIDRIVADLGLNGGRAGPGDAREDRRSPPCVTVLDGTAEAIPLRGDEVDAVVVGEAFHWFQTATAEIARVLTPGGGVALIWNTPTWSVQSTPWLEDIRQIVAHHREAAGDYPSGRGTWQDGFERTGLFEPLVRIQVIYAQTLDPSGFLALVASWSWIANLDSQQRQAVLDDVEEPVRGRVKIVIPYRTDLYLGRRRNPIG